MVVLRAAAWREERDQERAAWLAWHIAALQRSKRLPALARLLNKEPVKLTPDELAERKREHEDAVARWKARPRPGVTDG